MSQVKEPCEILWERESIPPFLIKSCKNVGLGVTVAGFLPKGENLSKSESVAWREASLRNGDGYLPQFIYLSDLYIQRGDQKRKRERR